jgi:hypothetical protein
VPRPVHSDWFGYFDRREAFAALLDPKRYDIAWLDGEVWSGRIMCWANEAAAILAKTITYPTGAWDIHGMAAAGDLAAIKELIGKAEDWARGAGALAAEIASRPGWERALKADGYEPHQQVLRKEL